MVDDTTRCLAGAAMKEAPHQNESHISSGLSLHPEFRVTALQNTLRRRLKRDIRSHEPNRALKAGLLVFATLVALSCPALASSASQSRLGKIISGAGEEIAASAPATAIAGPPDHRPTAGADAFPWNLGGLNVAPRASRLWGPWHASWFLRSVALCRVS